MRILSITSPDLSNGLGCRATVWVAGCSHKCPGCHNPHTWNYNIGTDIKEKENFNKIWKCIFNELSKPYIQGITLTGGDPLDQSDVNIETLITLVELINKEFPEKDIWIYAGDTFEVLTKNPIKRKLLTLCNVLVDGPFIKEKMQVGLAFRGSANQRIIDLQKTFETNSIVEMELQ